MRAMVAVAGILGEVILAMPAWGHDPPQGTGLAWLPAIASAGAGPAAERLVIRTNRGLIVQNIEGSGYEFLCNEAIGVAATEQAPLAVVDSGAVFVATFANGLMTGTPDLCQWQGHTDGIASMPAFDVALDPTQPATLYLLAGRSDAPTNFFVSHDVSSSWLPLAPSAIPYTRVRVAPSDSRRVYRTGVGLTADSHLLHRLSISDDGGATALEVQIPLQEWELQARVLAVDPMNPDRLYVHVEATSVELPERLIVSDDGGRTFTTSLTLLGFNALALSPEGDTVWAGGAEGLWRSTDHGNHFVPVASGALTRVTCLDFHAGRLFACAVMNNEFNVSVSDDGGESFRRLVSFAQVANVISCGSDAQVPAICAAPMAHWRSEVTTFAASAAIPGTVVGGLADATAPTSAAGCQVGPTPRPGVNPLALMVVGAIWAGLRRRAASRRAGL